LIKEKNWKKIKNRKIENKIQRNLHLILKKLKLVCECEATEN